MFFPSEEERDQYSRDLHAGFEDERRALELLYPKAEKVERLPSLPRSEEPEAT